MADENVFEGLSGTQKSAILMMLLGEDEASEILKKKGIYFLKGIKNK